MSTNTETYKLFYHPVSPPSRACKMFLERLKIPHTVVTIEFAKMEHRSKEFRRKNPFGQVPTLGVYRGAEKPVFIFESFAILKYLSSRFPNDLFPMQDR